MSYQAHNDEWTSINCEWSFGCYERSVDPKSSVLGKLYASKFCY